MEIGISTATFFGKANTEDTFELIRKIGARTCEVFLNTFYEYRPEFAALLCERKGDLRVHSVHSLNTNFEPQLFNASDRTRGDAEAIFRMVLESGRMLGAGNYTFHGVARLKKTGMYDNYADVGPKVERIRQIAAEYEISLCFENVPWAHYAHPGVFAGAREECPELCGCLDIIQAMQSGYSVDDYIKEMGDRIRTVHVCDYDDSGRLCAPGSGSFDFKRLFGLLRDHGAACPILMELYSGDYESLDELSRSFDYLNNLL